MAKLAMEVKTDALHTCLAKDRDAATREDQANAKVLPGYFFSAVLGAFPRLPTFRLSCRNSRLRGKRYVPNRGALAYV